MGGSVLFLLFFFIFLRHNTFLFLFLEKSFLSESFFAIQLFSKRYFSRIEIKIFKSSELTHFCFKTLFGEYQKLIIQQNSKIPR